MIKEVAHFFWHGTWGGFQKQCVSSFIKAGFNVQIWSYTGITLSGAASRNAAEIMPISLIDKWSLLFDTSLTGKTNIAVSIAQFSDLFRLKMLSEKGGWWFDCDCFCLKPVSDFHKLRQDKTIVVSFDSNGIDNFLPVGNGVLWLNKLNAENLYTECFAELNRLQFRTSNFLEVGPQLLTKYCISNKLLEQVLSSHVFLHSDVSLDPTSTNVESVVAQLRAMKSSYVYHIRPESCQNKLLLDEPLEGSILHHLFSGHLNEETLDEMFVSRCVTVRQRLIDITEIYITIFHRPVDFDSLMYYTNSSLSLGDIRQILTVEQHSRICFTS